MKVFRCMLPDTSLNVGAETEEEAAEKARQAIIDTIGTPDFLCWELTEKDYAPSERVLDIP